MCARKSIYTCEVYLFVAICLFPLHHCNILALDNNGGTINVVENAEIVKNIQRPDDSDFFYISMYHDPQIFSCDYNVMDSITLLYGTKAWLFPRQNVSLTIGYPPKAGSGNHIITGYRVILYSDVKTAKGYVMDGGIGDDRINLRLECTNVTMLHYEFVLFGVPRQAGNVWSIDTPGAGSQNLCSFKNVTGS
ncbi:hypothetical protein ACJJTC_004235 [Scirpophaga incertulas]